MKLKFYAREDLLVREDGVAPRIGEAARYYGRTFQPAAEKGQPGSYPATKEPFEVEIGTPDAAKCLKQCRKGTLFAADKDTASACGVALLELEFKDGAHVVKRKPSKAAG